MSPSLIRENRECATEVKFLVNRNIADAIRDWSRARLDRDPHGSGAAGDEYDISSIYFDTDKFDVFYQRSSFGRSKYRVRRYGASESLFLERKLKTAGMVTKRRSVVSATELARLQSVFDPTWPGSWFRRRLNLRSLRPMCQITYRRTARVKITSCGPVRLTLDEEIRACPTRTLGFDEGSLTGILTSAVIVEVKFRGTAPLLVKELIEAFTLNPKRMSKYRMAVAALGFVQPTPSGFASESLLDGQTSVGRREGLLDCTNPSIGSADVSQCCR